MIYTINLQHNKNLNLVTPRPKKGRHVTIAAHPWVGLSFPGSIQGLARLIIFPPSLTQWFTIYSSYLKYKISAKNSAEPRLKYKDLPAQTNQFIATFPSMGNHKFMNPKILFHNPPTKQLRRRNAYYTMAIFYKIQYNFSYKSN